MSKRTGRPKMKASKRRTNGPLAKARLTIDEKQRLHAACELNGWSESWIIRKRIEDLIGGKP